MNEENMINLSMRGERDLWLEFVHKLRKESKTVWEYLKPLIEKELKK